MWRFKKKKIRSDGACPFTVCHYKYEIWIYIKHFNNTLRSTYMYCLIKCIIIFTVNHMVIHSLFYLTFILTIFYSKFTFIFLVEIFSSVGYMMREPTVTVFCFYSMVFPLKFFYIVYIHLKTALNSTFSCWHK